MSSGLYLPPPLKQVEIPKKSGGFGKLGIPTVANRIRQTAAKLLIEPILDSAQRRMAREDEASISRDVHPLAPRGRSVWITGAV